MAANQKKERLPRDRDEAAERGMSPQRSLSYWGYNSPPFHTYELDTHGRTQRVDDPVTSSWHEGFYVTAAWGEVAGRLEAVALLIEAPAGQRVSADHFRRLLPIGGILADQRTELVARTRMQRVITETFRELSSELQTLLVSDETGVTSEQWSAGIAADEAQYGRRVKLAKAAQSRGTKLSHATLELTAEVYRQAFQDGQNPVQAVAAKFGLTNSGAAKRVQKARDARILGPAIAGRAGEAEMKDGAQ